MTGRPFSNWCATNLPTPADSLAKYFCTSVDAANSVGAMLTEIPSLDGRRHYLPNLAGKRDQKQFYVGSIEESPDGTVWPCVTFKSFKGQSAYWTPRDIAYREFDASRRYPMPASDNTVRTDYRAAADAAIEAAAKSAAEHDRQKAEGQAAAAAVAVAAWEAAAPCESHPYLTRKRVAAYGLRVAAAGVRAQLWNNDVGQWQEAQAVRAGDLLIPMHDEAGQLVNAQRIDATGLKRFIMGGRAHGCHFRIEGSTGRTILAEGYATGATWHAATGDTVALAFSAGALQAVAAYVTADAVAADNDEKHAGEKAAQATGLRYLMPPTLGDWNDYAAAHGLDAIRAAVANDNAEAFTRPYNLPAVELKGREQTWFNKYAAADTAAEAAALAWAIARRLSVRLPVSMTLDVLAELLRQCAPAGLMHPATIDAIRAALARLIDWRKQRALSAVSMSRAPAARHSVEINHALPELAAIDYSGVLLLNAPMGTGKTQRTGRAFANWAKHQDSRFLATCHRQSLVAELARVLGCDHYQETTGDMAWSVQALATCLPSIVKHAHAQIIDEAGHIFIDEIAQVLRSIASSVTVADKKTSADVFRALRDLVSRARCIIGADAGMDDRVISFIESCRPGERFRILTVPHQAQSLAVQFGFGPDALTSAYGEAMARLSQGERLWIGCGEKSRAIEAARVLSATGVRILLLHGDNRDNAEQAEFWSAPEAVSRQYDCVIHTGVISSGMSIEHREAGQWFDHGMLLTSGATITPADALQMLRRVRYLRTWTIAATPNNSHDIDNADAILAGMEQAASLEGMTAASCTDFDSFVAGIEADSARHRADFAAGLWWALEHQGFEVNRMAVTEAPELAANVKAIRADLRDERRAAILAAQDLTDAEAKRIRDRQSRTEEEQFSLLRHRIKNDLGLADLDGDDLEDWDDGRGPRQMDRFSAATKRLADRHDQTGDDLALHRFGKARALAYAWLLEGIDLAPSLRLTADLAGEIIGRVIERRYLLAFLAIVPAKWARHFGNDKNGTPKSFPAPAYPVREVGEILERMGLELKRREGTATHTCPDIPLEVITPSVGKSGRKLFHEITAESWEKVEMLAERRNRYRLAAEVKPANDDAYWLAVRRTLLANAGTMTRQTAAAKLRTSLDGREMTHGAKVTAFWMKHVLSERIAA